MYNDDDDIEEYDDEYEEQENQEDSSYQAGSLKNSPDGKRQKMMNTASKMSQKRNSKNANASPFSNKQNEISNRTQINNVTKPKGLKGSSVGIKNKLKIGTKKATKETAKVIGKAMMKVAAGLVVNPVFWIVMAIFALILIIFILTNQFTSQLDAKKNIDNYVLAGDFSDKAENKEKVEDYLKKQSLLLFSISDIDYMYETYYLSEKNKDHKFSEFMSVKFKDGNSSLKKMPEGAVSVNDERELLKHIFMSQKYDFNNVVWTEFSRNDLKGKEITDIKVDKDLGLKYPNDDKKTLKDFTKQLYPYLQTWQIPMSMFSGSVDSNTYRTSKEISFPYYIMAKAGSRIKMNRYIIETYTRTTITDTFGGYSQNNVKTQKKEWKIGKVYTYDVWFRNRNVFTPYNLSKAPDSSRTTTEQISRTVSSTDEKGNTTSYTEYGTRTTVVEVWADKLKSTTDSKGTHYTAQDVENFINENEY